MLKTLLKIFGWVFKGMMYIGVYASAFAIMIVTIPIWVPIALIYTAIKEKCSGKFTREMTGHQYEAYCAHKLRERGYKHLSVTPGSGDFGADVIGYDRRGRKVCFQCKKHEKPVGVSAVQEVLAAKYYYKADKAAVVTTSTFTPAARKLAKSGGVELIEKFYDIWPRKQHWVDEIEEIDAMID